MIFSNLKIQNFLSIKEVEINLDNKGLVLVSGENLDDPNFKSNGAGKTNLHESISWVLYGRTTKGLKGDEVLHKRVKKNCMVSLDIEDDTGDLYSIVRGRKHKEYKNSVLVFKGGTNITGKSDKDTNEFIESLIQMSYDVFTATILYSSSSFKFTSSTDAEMKKSLDNMLNMEFWNLCQEETKRRIDAIKDNIKTIENKIENNSKNIEILTEQKDDLLEKSKESKISYAKKKDELLERLEIVKNEYKDLEDTSLDLKGTLKDLKVLNTKIAEVAEQIDNFDKIFKNINATKVKMSETSGNIRVSDNNITDLTNKASRLLRKLDDKKALIGTACPVCGSDITKESLNKATAEIKEELKSIVKDLKLKKDSKLDDEKALNLLKEELEKFQNDYDERKSFLDKKAKYDQELADIKAKVSQNTRLKEAYERSKKQYDDTIAMLEKDILEYSGPYKDVYKDSLENLDIKISNYSTLLSNLKDQIEERNRELKNNEVWLNPFSNRGIKSLLLDSVTPFLNKKSNYYLSKLTSGSIEIEFKTQTENKSGNLQDKFNLDIRNNNGGDKYIANSDGERRRIDIAVNLALQDLISSRNSKKINVAFFDECFDSLDDIGAERVIEILNENHSNKRSMFVTTHNENLKSFFDKCIIMVKKGGFTKLKENL